MELSHFKDQLRTLGPDLNRWPPAERDAAVDLLARSEKAQDLFARLSAEDPLAPDRASNANGLADRIIARLPDEA